MTVVGSVEVEVVAAAVAERLNRDMDRPLNVAAARAGDRFGTLFGKAVGKVIAPFARRAGDDFGEEMSKKGHAHGITFGRLIGAGVAAGIGREVGRGLLDSLTTASETDAALGRSTDLFGNYSAGIEAYAKDTNRNLLLTRKAAIENADAFGELFRSVGIGQQPAAAMSGTLLKLSQSLAEVKHVKAEDAIAAIQGALHGSNGALEQWGIRLSDDRVKAEAFAIGLAKPVKDAAAIESAQIRVSAATANLTKVQREHGAGTLAAAQAQDTLDRATATLQKAMEGQKVTLTDAQRTQAIYSLLVKDTAGAQTEAARTSGDYGQSAQILHRNLGNLADTIGHQLLPYGLQATDWLADFSRQVETGTGVGGEFRSTLGGVVDDLRAVGGLLNNTVVPVIQFFADHPTVFKAAAEGMAAYATASKAASIWNARLAVSVPAVAVGEAAVAAESAAAAGGVAAVGGASALALPQIAAMSAALLGVYELWKSIKGFQEDQKFYKNLPNTYDNLGTQAQKWYDQDPTDYIAKHPDFQPPGSAADPLATSKNDNADRSGKRAKKTAEDLHATQVRMRDESIKQAKATQYAADQLAAYQERQRLAVEAAGDAARARGEAVTHQLEAQATAVQKQVAGLTAATDKMRQFRAEIVQDAAAFTSLTSLVQDPSRATAGGILGTLQTRIRAEQLFAKNLATLGKRGLDKGVLAELAQAGPEQRAFASALAMASPDQIRQLNAAERASRIQGQVLGSQATDRQFGAGAIAKNQAALAEQNRRLAHLEQLISQQPALIGKAVEQAQRNVKVSQKTSTRTTVTR